MVSVGGTVTRKEFLGDGVVKCSLIISREAITDQGSKVICTKEISTIFNVRDFVIDELPKTCYDCPAGFMCSDGCGRNVPLDSTKRSENCKLITYRQFLDRNHISY